MPDTAIGGCVNLYAISPQTDTEADRDAARRIDGLQNRFFLDALLRGRVPGRRPRGPEPDHAPAGSSRTGTWQLIAAPLDMLLINYYSRFTVSGAPGGVRVGGRGADRLRVALGRQRARAASSTAAAR